MRLINGDCLEEMDKLIAEGVKVDAIICDPPYGTTACKWDSVIPFEAMWERLNKLIKDNGAIVLFGSEPFSSALRMSNLKNYKYDWNWEKSKATLFTLAKKRPLKSDENICIFYAKQPTYNPQMGKGKPFKGRNNVSEYKEPTESWNIKQGSRADNTGTRYPRTNIKIPNENRVGQHPTQKPVALMEYLIKTYTNENETVLDFTMGSGTTGVACKNLGRDFIGIEKDEKYYNIGKERIEGQLI
jgi:site-specific DNA-methyltransferase (adenine-specific)